MKRFNFYNFALAAKSSIENRIVKVICWLLIIIFQFSLISACADRSLSTETTPTTPTTASTPSNDDSFEQKTPSGELRVWWTPRNNLNPLKDNTYTGKALYQLVYGSLITFDEDDSLVLDLASDLIWTQEASELVIKIGENIYFHDGSALKAQDVLVALTYVWSENGGPDFVIPDQDSPVDEPPASSDEQEQAQTEDEKIDDDQEQNDDLDQDEDEALDDSGEQDYISWQQYPLRRDQAEVFAALDTLEIVDEHTIKCTFLETVPEFTAYLDFPIIPLKAWAELEENPWQIIPGTGAFKIDAWEEEELILSHTNDGENTYAENALKNIRVKQYLNVNEAMEALADDQLDLVLLDGEQYSNYQLRKNLELVKFDAPESVFLGINYNKGYFTTAATVLPLKSLLSSENMLTDNPWPGLPNDYPLSVHNFIFSTQASHDYTTALEELALAQDLSLTIAPQPILTEDDNNTTELPKEGSQLQEPEANDDKSIDADIAAEISPHMQTIIILVLNSDYHEYIGKNVAALLDPFFDVELNILPPDEYLDAIERETYDLVLYHSYLPLIKDPAWLYGPDMSVLGLDFLANQDFDFFDYNSRRLQLYSYHHYWYMISETDRMNDDMKGKYSALLQEIAVSSPYIHLFLPYAALAYGDRVKGHSVPNKYHPYNEIEELWIWSGQ